MIYDLHEEYLVYKMIIPRAIWSNSGGLFSTVMDMLRRIDARNVKYVAEYFLGLYNSLPI